MFDSNIWGVPVAKKVYMGAPIKTLRALAGMSNSQLAQKLGVSSSRVQALQHAHFITPEVAHRVAQALGVSVEALGEHEVFVSEGYRLLKAIPRRWPATKKRAAALLGVAPDELEVLVGAAP